MTAPEPPNLNDPLAACRRLGAVLERAAELEARARSAADDSVRLPLVQFVSAQLAMRIASALAPDWPAGDPVHVAVFGGTNSGKSTVLNVLLGRAAAGMNPLARYSQHPEAYRPAALGDRWWQDCPTRFAGYRRYLDQHPPRQSDEDLAAGRYVPAFAVLDPATSSKSDAISPPATVKAVMWDSPDFSTEEARAYLNAVVDTVALADVVLMAVTDESYADDRGAGLLRMVGESSVSLHLVANKLSDNRDLLEDVRTKLAAQLRRPAPLHPLPRVAGATPEDRLAALLATDAAAVLRGTIAHEAGRGAELKREALAAAVGFIRSRLEEALRPLADEARLAAGWAGAVERVTRAQLLDRYDAEYLEGRKYGEFNRTLVRLMELLAIPGIGQVLAVAGKIVRTPFRIVSGLFKRLFRGDGEESLARAPEHEVLAGLIENWLAVLRGDAQKQAAGSADPAWAEVVRKLDSAEFRDRMFNDFADAYADHQAKVAEEIDRRARAIYERLEERPVLLNSLRAGNVLVSAGSVVLVIKSAGLNWSDAVVGPVVAGMLHVLLESGLEQYIEAQKAALKRTQHDLMAEIVETRLAAPVRALFAGSGSAGEADAARRDFALIEQAALRVARGEG